MPFNTLPCFVQEFRGWLSFDSGVAGIGELRGGVVAPDDDVLHVLDGDAALLGQLSHGPVLR